MCYNYETLVKRGIERSKRELGEDAVMQNLSEHEQLFLNLPYEFDPDSLQGNTSLVYSSASVFPGAEAIVLPINSKYLTYYNFGFMPDWASGMDDKRKNFNARSDSLRSLNYWKKAWYNQQRCIIPAKGFYETDRVSKKRYLFSSKSKEPVYFAGIFNHWKDPISQNIHKTFAIITTEPNELVAPIHNRMPVMLSLKDHEIWLSEQSGEAKAFELLRPFDANLMHQQEIELPPRKTKIKPQLGFDFDGLN
ncbi:MAG: SOS response-associated peptidase [Bacteroidetes bacterium]|nr:SOS response-associated peptidase [Bacteroidota bacterium]MBK9799568.1 SOS response-associated peptidase [Bacteroidota bacterium]